MSKKTPNKRNPFKNWYERWKEKLPPIQRTYYRYSRNILWNSRDRIILSGLAIVGIIALSVYVLSIVAHTPSWLSLIIAFAILVAYVYFPLKYVWQNFNQVSVEYRLNTNIMFLKRRIDLLNKVKEKKNYRSFQFLITDLRRNLIDYLENSEIVSPPVANFELDRLRKNIDIFFNCASETLVPINKLFSLEDEIEASKYEDEGEPPDKILEWENQDLLRLETGQFDHFDLQAMDEFLDHLWDVLFDKEPKPYLISSFKHPVNIMLLSKFFIKWNQKISVCYNCKSVFKKASDDIEEYYKSMSELESEKRKRRWELRDDVIVVLVSVVLSTLIQYLIHG
jgi:hypothetical protein